MAKQKTDNCDPVYLSHYFDALSTNKELEETDRRNTIGNMIRGCYNYKTSNGGNGAPVKQVKAKRKPSGYNLFIGDCAKKDENAKESKDMKTCSIEWKNMDEFHKNEWRAKAAESRLY